MQVLGHVWWFQIFTSKAFAPAVEVEGFHFYLSYTFASRHSTLDFCLGGQRSR